MPEMHWKEPGFTYSAGEPLKKKLKKQKIHDIFIKTS